jgi:hypothetical protein
MSIKTNLITKKGWAEIYEILYGCYAIGHNSKLILSNFLFSAKTIVTDTETCKVG